MVQNHGEEANEIKFSMWTESDLLNGLFLILREAAAPSQCDKPRIPAGKVDERRISALPSDFAHRFCSASLSPALPSAYPPPGGVWMASPVLFWRILQFKQNMHREPCVQCAKLLRRQHTQIKTLTYHYPVCSLRVSSQTSPPPEVTTSPNFPHNRFMLPALLYSG